MREHQQKVPSQAAEHYEIAQQYLATIDRLTNWTSAAPASRRSSTGPTRRRSKSWGRVEEAPDWIEARMALASVYYTEKDYEAARTSTRRSSARSGERARRVLPRTVEYYIRHAEQAADQQEALERAASGKRRVEGPHPPVRPPAAD